jgi:hypothetical protein
VSVISLCHCWDVGYPEEQTSIIERELFDQVQALLKSNSVERVAQRSRSGALLMGKLLMIAAMS